MATVRRTAPRIEPVLHRELRAGDHDDLRPRADLDRSRFEQVRADHLDLGNGSAISECHFDGLAADDLELSSSRVNDTTLAGLDVPVARANRGVWRDVEIGPGRVGSFEAYDAQWRRVHLVGCKLTYVNLRGSELLDVVFTDCQIDELDLGRARLTRVALPGTRVAHLDVQNAGLEHVDLRDTTLSDVSGVNHLRGATVTSAQLVLLAPLLAREIGLEVEG